MAEPMGSPTGTGNPPGQYSDSYLNEPSGSGEGHFVKKASYRGDMHVGIADTENVVGNQPQQDIETPIEKRSNKTASY
jgi:hypothetical protein